MLDPVEMPDLQEVVRQRIKEFILESGLREGDRLPSEEELGGRLAVSRTALREVLRGLEALGIISSRRGSGRYVRKFNFEAILDNLAYSLFYDVHTFEELLDVRQKLEEGFLEEAIEALTDGTLAELRTILDGMEAKVAKGVTGETLWAEDIAFHRTLYQPTGNTLLLKLLEIFWNVQKNLHSHLPYETDNPEQYLRQHQALAAALEARDVELARFRLVEHFEGVRRWIAREKNAALDEELA